MKDIIDEYKGEKYRMTHIDEATKMFNRGYEILLQTSRRRLCDVRVIPKVLTNKNPGTILEQREPFKQACCNKDNGQAAVTWVKLSDYQEWQKYFYGDYLNKKDKPKKKNFFRIF